jgi:hypothetical protein
LAVGACRTFSAAPLVSIDFFLGKIGTIGVETSVATITNHQLGLVMRLVAENAELAMRASPLLYLRLDHRFVCNGRRQAVGMVTFSTVVTNDNILVAVCHLSSLIQGHVGST